MPCNMFQNNILSKYAYTVQVREYAKTRLNDNNRIVKISGESLIAERPW